MKLLTAEVDGSPAVGVVVPGTSTFVDLALASVKDAGSAPPWTRSLRTFIEAGSESLEAATSIMLEPPAFAVRAISDVRLLVPLRPTRLRDASLFIEHLVVARERVAREAAADAPDPESAFRELMETTYKLPELFLERIVYYQADRLCLSGPDEVITWPEYSTVADFELEFAAVIGRPGHGVRHDEARSHIFGYTIFNDWSARDEQQRVMKTGLGLGEGKDFLGSNTLGPFVVTADEIPDPYSLRMLARVNGETWTDRSTKSMNSTFEDAVIQFSRTNPLHSGEVIGSGTVRGGCGFERGEYLKDGDVVELEIEGIGVLRNTVRIPALRY